MYELLLIMVGVVTSYLFVAIEEKYKQSKATAPKPEKSPAELQLENRNKQIEQTVRSLRFFKGNPENFKKFKAVEAHKGNVTYEYRNKDVLYTVYYEHSKFVSVDIVYNSEQLLSYGFDMRYGRKKGEVVKKELNHALFDYFGTEETIQVINVFLEQVKWTSYWNQISPDTIIKREEPVIDQTPEAPSSPKEPVIHSRTATEELQYILNLISENADAIDTDILVLFQQILEQIEKCLRGMDEHETETRHLLEHLLQKDLELLLSSYNELSTNSKEDVQEKVQNALIIIQRKTDEIAQLLEKRNVHEVEKAVQVIHARNY